MSLTFKDKMKNDLVLGCFINFSSPDLVEIIAYAGYDFVILDNEHGSLSYESINHMIRAAKSLNIEPIVRVSYDESSIQKSLDQGARGIQVPWVNNVEDAKEVVNKAKYSPVGKRGVSFSTPAAYYGNLNEENFTSEQNNNTLISVQIETEEAVKNFEDIISLSNVDIAFIGTADLANDMGYEKASHERVQNTVSDLFKKARDYDIQMGIVASDEESIKNAKNLGASYVSIVANKVISNSLKDLCLFARK